MASNAASSVQFRVNGTEMARGRTKLSAARAWTLELSPAPRGASKVNVETTVTNGSFILGPENAGNFCIARRSRGISAIVSRRLPRSRLLARVVESLFRDITSGWAVIHANRLSVVTSPAIGQPSILYRQLGPTRSTGSAPFSRERVSVQSGCISSEAPAIGHEVARSLYDPLHRSSSQRRSWR